MITFAHRLVSAQSGVEMITFPHSLVSAQSGIEMITFPHRLVSAQSGVEMITFPHRLVSARHITRNKDYENLLAEKAKSGFTDAEVGIRTGKTMFMDQAEKHRVRKKMENTELASGSSGLQANGDAPVIKASLGAALMTLEEVVEDENEKDSQTKFQELPSINVTPANPSKPTWNRDVEVVPGPSHSPESEASSLSSTPHGPSPVPESVPTFKKSKRKSYSYVHDYQQTMHVQYMYPQHC